MGALEELGAFLDTSSTRYTAGTNLFYGYTPDDPDTVTTLFETGGLPPEHVFAGDLPVWERPSMQIVCRSTSYQTARANAHAAWVIVQKVANEALSGKTWLRCTPIQSPFLLERDSQGRVVIGFNAMCMRRTTST